MLNNKICRGCASSFVDTSTRRPISYCSRSCYKKAWTLENKEKVQKAKQKYLDTFPEKRKESSIKYRKKNPAYYTEYASFRSRNVKQAKPSWLGEFEFLWLFEIYDLAKRRGMEVDHIIPVKHPKVCGLHVPWNLQLLSPEQNRKKSNKFQDEDIICIVKDSNE